MECSGNHGLKLRMLTLRMTGERCVNIDLYDGNAKSEILKKM